MRRKGSLGIALGALMMLTFAAPAQAAPEQTFVEVAICDRSGGEARVPARSDTTIYYGWVTKSRRQVVKFLERSYVELTVDGERIPNADLLWTKPIQGPSGWYTFWDYRLGRLGHGNSIDTTFTLVFTERHWDGYGWFEE